MEKNILIYLSLNILQNPAIADVYTEHSCPVNVAKYSPSGFYIASGGTLLIIFKYYINISHTYIYLNYLRIQYNNEELLYII